MAIIEFPFDQKEQITRELQEWVEAELGVELGRFDAEHLLNFFSEKMGTQFYNKGLSDASAALSKQMDSIVDAIGQLEKM